MRIWGSNGWSTDVIDETFSGFENDGGVKPEGGTAATDCGQNHSSGFNHSLIIDHTSADHTSYFLLQFDNQSGTDHD